VDAKHESPVELLDLSNLHPAKGARRPRKRIGRGIGSGTGKTSGRGHKGRGARSGGNTPPGYEGGQMPLQRRLPKRGFHNPTRERYAVVNVGDLDRFDDGATIDRDALVAAGLGHKSRPTKLLANGDVAKRLTVKVEKASEAARAKITAAGGAVELMPAAAEPGTSSRDEVS
jgi:large subunit ribosomal protein L15